MSDDNLSTVVWPSEEWCAEYRRQATPALIKMATTYANRRLALWDGAVCSASAGELVQNELTAVFAGVVRWHPDRVSLVDQVCDRVRLVLDRLGRLSRRVIRIDWLEGNGGDVKEVDRALSYVVHPGDAIDQSVIARDAMAWLWRVSAGDQDGLLCLNAMLTGAVSISEIERMTGLEPAIVQSAKKRIKRRMIDAPVSLRQRVAELFS